MEEYKRKGRLMLQLIGSILSLMADVSNIAALGIAIYRIIQSRRSNRPAKG